MTAGQVIELLATRHSKDVFVPECKDGPTQSSSHLRLDAWAMRRSWSDAATFGYEVKVTRADWLRDDKWVYYIPLVNHFSVVAPKGIVQATELPEGVGLLEVVGEKRLLTRKKAARKEIQHPETLYMYVLMCRARIERETYETSRLDYWRNWIAQKAESRGIGYQVRAKIREHVERVEHENRMLKARIDQAEAVEARAKRLGLWDMRSWEKDEQTVRRARLGDLGLDDRLPSEIRSLVTHLQRMGERIDQAIALEPNEYDEPSFPLDG